MERYQIENIYKINNINDYRLKSTDDLLKCHGINYIEVEGFKRLDDINKQIFKEFLVNIYNALGLESRATLQPKGIYFVEDNEYLAKETPEDDYLIPIGRVIIEICRNGEKDILHDWKDENYKHLKVEKTDVSTYLRFEYEHQGRKEWLHVVDEKTWY